MEIRKRCLEEEDIYEEFVCNLNATTLLLAILSSIFHHTFGYVGIVILFFSILMNSFAFLAKFVLEKYEEEPIDMNFSKSFIASLVISVVFQVPIILWITYICHIILSIYIPPMGSMNKDAEDFVAVFFAITTFLTCSYFVSIKYRLEFSFQSNQFHCILGSFLSNTKTQNCSVRDVACHVFSIADYGLYGLRISL